MYKAIQYHIIISYHIISYHIISYHNRSLIPNDLPASRIQDSAGTKNRHAAEDPAESPQEPCLETKPTCPGLQQVGFCQKDWSPVLSSSYHLVNKRAAIENDHLVGVLMKIVIFHTVAMLNYQRERFGNLPLSNGAR